MVLLSVIVSDLYAQESYRGKTLVMVSGVPEGGPVEQLITQIYTEAFQRLGIKMTYQFYPFKRATGMAVQEKIDGELTRKFSYGNKHPNLVRVEEPAYTDRFIAFATDPAIQLQGWESIRITNLRIDYQRGIHGIEQQLRILTGRNRISPLNNDQMGLRRLIADRTDIYISGENFVKGLLQTEEFQNSGIRIAGIMEEVPIYAYLLKKHQKIGPKLSSVLRQMKNEGLIDQYLAHAFQYPE